MRRVGIEITNELRIDGNVLGHDIVNEILDELTIENKEKLVAKRMNRWKWEELPDDFLLANLDGDTLVMPRGYMVQLKLLLADHGLEIQLHDQRKWLRGELFKWRKKFISREHQVEAVRQMRLHQQGIYEAPTGSGKTLSCVKLIHDLSPAKSIILVDQLGLLNQWISELNLWLSPGGSVGQIGSGAWIDNKRITVATLQTLWSEFKDLLENGAQINWFDQFDLVIVDECFPQGSLISTPNGKIPIENLKIGDKIFGIDHRTGRKIVTTIRRVFSKRSNNLVDLVGIRMTPNHPVLTQRGYIRADCIQESDIIVFEEEGISQNMRGVWAGFPSVVAERKVLLEALRNEKSCFQTRQSFQDQWQIYTEEIFKNTTNKWLCAFEWWERSRINKTSEDFIERIRSQMGARIYNPNWYTRKWYANTLQDRFGLTKEEIWNRNRRAVSSIKDSEGTRQTKARISEFARLGNNPCYKQRCVALPVEGNTTYQVFNIETDSGNYFSNGLLVHNCHHISAKTIQAIVDRFPAKYRLGVSATPDRKDGKFEYALNILGEVFHQDDEKILRDRGILVKPHVEAVKTDFKFAYWTDHESDKDGMCEKPDCDIKHKHSHRNNYAKLKSELVKDEERNQCVVDTIASQIGEKHIHLLITNEIRQLDLIRNLALENPRLRKLPLLRMVGQSTKKAKNEILTQMKELPEAVLFATVAKEGLDIPRVDRIYLPFPISNPKVTQQSIGRATRVAEGKKDTIIFDFFDVNIEVLKKQFRKRHYQCYNKLGIEVII